jgi:hypothetical protein
VLRMIFFASFIRLGEWSEKYHEQT